MRLFFLTLLLFLSFSIHLSAQENLLKNGSFEEDLATHSITPTDWIDCGFEGESPADIHPSGTFAVTKPPKHGDTYLGLVTRDIGTWERIGQKLEKPLKAGQPYQLMAWLARSNIYVSVSKLTNQRANYIQPIQFRVLGANSINSTGELLAKTENVVSTEWELFQLEWIPEKDYGFLIIEAYYDPEVLADYNGNILVDNLILTRKEE